MNPLLRDPMTPLAFDRVTPEHIHEAAERAIAEAKAAKQAIVDAPADDKQRRLWGRDDLDFALDTIVSPLYLLNETHPDAAVREACQRELEKLFAFGNELDLDEPYYQSFKAFADNKPELNPVEARYAKKTMDAYLRNGFQLDAEGRQRLKEIDDALTVKELQFNKNVADAEAQLHFSPEELPGLSEDFIEEHRTADGDCLITTQRPDYDAVMKHCSREDTRRQLYFAYQNRAQDKNLTLLDEILALRVKRMKLLGFPTFADFKLENVMAKKPETVWRFIEELSAKLDAKARADYEALKAFWQTDAIPQWSRSFVTERYREAHFQINEEEVKAYFPLERVFDGLFHLAQTLFQVRFVKSGDLPVWHPEVRAFEIHDDDRLVGRFYLDLHPRPNKYSHAACFGLKSGKRGPEGYYPPEAALVCNFPKPTKSQPSLLTHDDVETMFHEFGHLLHQLLTVSPLCAFAGTSVARDFVEMPSQIMENWVWEKESLQTFAAHYETGETIPGALVDKLIAARHLNSGIDNQQQLFYAALDMTLHHGFEPTTPEAVADIVQRLQAKYTQFQTVPGTHFQGAFTHLMGYAAGYYGYLWSRVYADDMFSVFKHRGLYDREAGKKLRDIVLAKGDTEEPMALIEAFLGREPRMEAFLANLGVTEAAA